MSLTGSDLAYTIARSGQARSGAARSGYILAEPVDLTQPIIVIDGIVTGPAASRRVLIASLSVQDLLNETPNTCTFTVQGARPDEGSDIAIMLNGAKLFAGSIVRVTETYAVGNPRHILWQVEGIDWTWRLNARLVSGRYSATNAADIAADLMARFAPPGYTLEIPETLPDVDEISFTNVVLMEAFAQLAQRIGGYASCNYDRQVGLWLTDSGTPPIALTPSHPSLETLTYSRDLSQIVTRALVEGGGSNVLADVLIGETRLPVIDLAWYNAAGGRVVCGPQRLTYTGLVSGGAGAYVGPGIAPSSAPSAATKAGSGLGVGAYWYGYTWQTATGETLLSPIALVYTTGQLPNPTAAPTEDFVNMSDSGSLVKGGKYRFKYAYATNTTRPPTAGAQVTMASPASAVITCPTSGIIMLRVPQPTNTAAVRIYIYRTTNNGSTYYYDSEWDLGSWGGYLVQASTQSDSTLNDNVREPTSNTTVSQGQQVQLSGIATGPSGTTNRRIYRTTANGPAPLKFLTTLAGNSATTLVDAAADATLGAGPPSTDTSGLTSTAGQALAGSPSIVVSSAGPFGAQGWAVVAGNQAIRYSGVSGNTLTGIPASGPGALTASVNYGTPILVAAQLVGIPASGPGAIILAVKQGDPVNLLVIVDDLTAQAAMAALVGGDGIVEAVLVDNRIAEPEALSRAQALLAQKKDPQETLRYRVRDPLTRSGASIVVDLPSLGIAGTFKLQDVTIGGFLGTSTFPTYDAAASSSRFTFEDLLRQLRSQPRQLPV